MKGIVSGRTVRVLKILETCYFEKRVDFADLADINDCTKITVKTDVEYIEQYWSDILD